MHDSAEKIAAIPPDLIDAYWSTVERHVERFEHKTLLIAAETLKKQLKNAERQLWIAYAGGRVLGIVVTYVYQTARGQICCIWAACGDTDEYAQIQRFRLEIERWAREIGCSAIEIQGRPGWARLFPDFKRTAIVLEKSLCP